MGEDDLMSFNGLVGLVTRWWYVVGLGLVGTMALAILASGHVSSRYEMSASVVLLPPQSTIGVGGNPYLAMGGLDAAADVTAASMSSQVVQERVVAAGATSTVVRDGSTAAPILLITVEASSSASASTALAILIRSVPTSLAAMQESADVAQGALLGSKLVASSTRPTVSISPKLRVLLLAVVGGLGATLVLVALVDRLVGRRRQRRALRASAVPPARHGWHEDPLDPVTDVDEAAPAGAEEPVAELALSDRRG